ncbi:hypothetical protein [Arthrobacter antibioticus]|nr:hypothetical protein [Arthrobacter sp. H35-MC1]MDJ0316865.1 hypothetical protein [Arthrobacter sp. H35-MC1]
MLSNDGGGCESVGTQDGNTGHYQDIVWNLVAAEAVHNLSITGDGP